MHGVPNIHGVSSSSLQPYGALLQPGKGTDCAAFGLLFASASLPDGWGLFGFAISAKSSSSLSLRFRAFFLCDGHGSAVALPLTKALASSVCPHFAWIGSSAEQYISKLRPIIANTVYKNVRNAVTEWNQRSFDSQNDGISQLRKDIESALSTLQNDIDLEFEAIDNVLDRDNGATLVLGLSLDISRTSEPSDLKMYPRIAFFVNVGDSSMMLIDRTNGLPLSVWRRPEIDSETSTCSFEDTLASFPSKLREGQCRSAVQEDFNKVKNFFREVRQGFLRTYPIFSAESAYGLTMTNSLGNRNHDGCLLGRTTVYSFNLDTEISIDEVIAVFVSDGVKDVLDARDIATTFLSIENAVSRASGQSLENCDINDLIDELVPLSSNIDTFDSSSKEALLDLIMDCDMAGYVDLQSACSAIVNMAMMRRSYDDLTCLAVQLPMKISQNFDPVTKLDPHTASQNSYKQSFDLESELPLNKSTFNNEIFMQSTEFNPQSFCLHWSSETDSKVRKDFDNEEEPAFSATAFVNVSPPDKLIDTKSQIEIVGCFSTPIPQQLEEQQNQFPSISNVFSKRKIELECKDLDDKSDKKKNKHDITLESCDFLDDKVCTKNETYQIIPLGLNETGQIHESQISTQQRDMFSLPQITSPQITSTLGFSDKSALVHETLQRETIKFVPITNLDDQIFSDDMEVNNIGEHDDCFNKVSVIGEATKEILVCEILADVNQDHECRDNKNDNNDEIKQNIHGNRKSIHSNCKEDTSGKSDYYFYDNNKTLLVSELKPEINGITAENAQDTQLDVDKTNQGN
ncbi:hypothetical protein HK096_002377 [Nowakowskiella sp. JEL0078]|nr:hypothetical protein HK096_002377 [Nowakowskiella sp. JEL0078]